MSGVSARVQLGFREEKFCQLVVLGSSQAEAFRKSFPKSLKWKPETVWSKASILASDEMVRARIAELCEEIRESAHLTILKHLEELERIKRDARLDREHGVVLKAEELRGKASGFYVTRVEGGKPGEFDEHDEAAARKRIAERCARLGMPVPEEVLRLPAPAEAK